MLDLSPALAQGSDLRLLLDRVERMQRELSTLQRHVYRGGGARTPPGAAPANLGGSIDTPAAARLHVRITQLEEQLRRLTGRIEEVQHATGKINKRLEKLVVDIDFRLSALERAAKARDAGTGQQLGEGGAAAPGANGPSGPVLSPRPGVLADIPAGKSGRARAALKPSATAAQTAAVVPPKKTPKKQYSHAIALMQAERFSEAERALRGFIDGNPENKLVANAQYWLGETFYARKDYQRAAFTFAQGFQKFPKGSKAPDNLLKLGMSLARLGRKKEACTTFSRLVQDFPRASATLKSRVARQQRTHDCT